MHLISITERQNNMQFDNGSYKIELRNEIFRKVNEKGEKKTAKKIERVWPRKLYPFGNGSYNFEKDTKLQRENVKYI